MSQMTLDRLRNELHPIVTPIHTFERVDRTYLAFLVREAAFSKHARPRLWVQYMSFVACPKSHLNPRIVEVENGFRIADEVASPPCDCEGTHVLSILVHGATSLQLPRDRFLLSHSKLYRWENLAGLLIPRPMMGCPKGWMIIMEDADGDIQAGWRLITLDEFRALAAHKTGSDNRLFHIKAKYDPQATTPDLLISAAEISEMKEAVERAPTPSKKNLRKLLTMALRSSARENRRGSCGVRVYGGTLYYALALIKHVSEQEQPEANIGCLRAFAHQWPCHVDVNPQLFPNFGCTDGEGVQI
ncbi:BZ3500_MvSof-1268-A1-R1_Chr5-3g08269 [Microbotryum saponariae]|uniref:BZ3500_MvSof-1268-A1-R1_Chr5-3g08269 protein n=1 Tax=Microbotryum saponariae TaxID=289078 RepID=A0A2X0L8C4_9BASI|nr:BZ3500_MvSof-1268-A1-R1_Chr5-3g08269 [Microbotryum saponariae]SDA08377.1 BZ3501_MvSof-1269-A2-R1_Chr5-3g07997 [Microbotryum saponariae]